MEKNLSVRLHGKKDLRIEEVDIPEPCPDEVVVKPAFVGVCGTDLHFYNTAEIGCYILEKPTTLGHETSAIVYKLGAKVQGLQIGDRVTIDPNLACGDCYYCLADRSNLCQKCRITGIPNTDGSFARFMVTPASSCHILPDYLSLEEGSFIEPMSVVTWGFKRCPVQAEESVVIIGAGTIGLLAIQVAKAHGAGTVLVVDVVQSRLDVAVKLGADQILLVDPKLEPCANAKRIKDTLDREADLCVECSGTTGTVDTAILSTRRAGRLLMLGVGEMKMNVNLGLAALNEIDVIGSVCNHNTFPESIELVASGKVKVTPLISRKLPLQEFMEALNLLKNGPSDCIKILIDCQK